MNFRGHGTAGKRSSFSSLECVFSNVWGESHIPTCVSPPSSAGTFWSHVSHGTAAFHWDKHTARTHHTSPCGLCTLAVLLALSPPRWACWGLPCALLEPRSSPTDVSMCASDLQRAEVTQPLQGHEQSCLCRFPISLFPQGSPPRLISMHNMDGSYQQNNTRATILL